MVGVLVKVLAADGDLDPSFNTDGKVTTNFAGGSEQAHAVAIQSDGKIVAAGYAAHFVDSVAAGGNVDFAVARYTTSGNLDGTFGDGGIVLIDFNSSDDQANAVAIQSDGKIVVAGFATVEGRNFALARLNTDGSLDDGTLDDPTPGDSFGTGGKVETFINGTDVINDIVIQPDGKIVAAGATGTVTVTVAAALDGQEFALARYNEDGSLDSGTMGDSTAGDSFGDGGIVITDFPGPSDDAAYGVALQTDGKIVAAGVTSPIPTPGVVAGGTGSDFALARYNEDGSLDSGGMGDTTPSDDFGTAGLVVTDFNGGDDVGRDVVIQSDGKIVVGGYTIESETGFDFALARYNTDGGLDDGTGDDSTPGDDFGGDGKVITDFDATTDSGYALAIQADGKIVLAGTSGPRFSDFSEGAGLAPDGSSGFDFALARYNTNGSLDNTFSTDGLVTTDFFSSTDEARGVAIQKDGKIVAAGFADNAGQQFALARYLVTINEADLSISVTDTPDPVVGGKNITYKVKITNNGPALAHNVTLFDRTPTSSHFISARPSQGTCDVEGTDGALVTCHLGNLPNGAMAIVTIVVQTLTVGNTIYDATADVSASETDPDPSDNSVFVSTRVIDFRKLSFSPPIVTGGCQNTVGTLLLTSAAPEGGLRVNLTDNSEDVDVPSVINVPGGQTSVNFTATTHTVSSEQIVTVTAFIGMNSITGRIKLLPVRVSQLTFSPNPVHGGSPATGMVTLTCAPDQDVVVKVRSDKAAAKPVQTQFVIPAGHTTGQFMISTLHVSSPTNVTFTVLANGGSKSAVLQVIP
jgi:uncharacterized delta-60 repeat protein/uncharacterized repeat protein (TIGR01451 family)